MASAGIVACGAAFHRRPFQPLHQQQAKGRIELLEQGRQGGAHDPRTHQHDVVAVHSGGVALFRLWVDRNGAFLG